MRDRGYDSAFSWEKGGSASLSGESLFSLLEDVLKKGVPFRFRARGYSMSPLIKDGDIITIAPLVNNPSLGDIIAFRHHGKSFVHRIVGRKGDAYLIQGDNNIGLDGLVPKSQILGRLIRIERNERKVYLGLGPERFIIALLFSGRLHLIRNLLVSSIQKIQSLTLYRKCIKLFPCRVDISEAAEEDISLFYKWVNPDYEGPFSTGTAVTNFIAKRGEKIVGFVQLVRNTKGIYSGYGLFSLTIKTLYRGLGLGEALTLKVIEKAQDEGAEELHLFVFEDNRRAIMLYRKLGFAINRFPQVEEKLEEERKSCGGRRRILMIKKF